ncbi:FYDLN acid domain-containing protein [Oceanibacterium hippocampi]|uniref:FYDLN acid domain-containing protein n=1 Tax=Oceanibacterium hippocampi TaxID=745714 RepID=UPI000A270673|nr:FYDLN acid domain-containing protein [Oceanibacterium hippocampi]
MGGGEYVFAASHESVVHAPQESFHGNLGVFRARPGDADVSRAERGEKHTCAGCGMKFFDMGKADATCPGCGDKPPPPRLKKSSGPPRKTARPVFSRQS